MDFRYTPEQEAFRERLSTWLDRNMAEVFGENYDPQARGGEDSEARWQRTKEWHRRLYEAGYVALHWPKEWGGGGADLVEQAIYQDEVLKRGLPLYGANQLAIDRIGPTLMYMGNDEQRQRYLHKMLTAEEIWCQGYSEPNAGSDLAGLQTRAVIDGDNFVINGQKVWTSLAQRAEMQILLVRTDPDAPKHRGISYLLVDMKTPGITVRPLVQITGESDFNEVFYDNVRVPRKNLVGELNQGWQVSLATLMYERVSGGTRHPIERTVNELLDLAKTVEFGGMPASQHPYVRQKLAELSTDAHTSVAQSSRQVVGAEDHLTGAFDRAEEAKQPLLQNREVAGSPDTRENSSSVTST